MKKYNTEYNFLWIAKKLCLEVLEQNGIFLFGLKWGEGKVGDMFGIPRKARIGGLNWADKNPKKAIKILKSL